MTDLNAQPRLTQARLKQLLQYDADTGDFFWIRGRRAKTGDGTKAGCLTKAGYVMIKVDGANHWAHHLAWLYVTGAWAAQYIDHRDTQKSNNRWENLREATHAQNQQNSGRQRNNKSGYKGVSLYKRDGSWRACIGNGGTRLHLGYFDTPEAAHAAYVEKARVLYGEFARVA